MGCAPVRAAVHGGQLAPDRGRGGVHRQRLRRPPVVSSAALAPVATQLDIDVEHRLMIDGVAPGWESYEAAVAAHPATPVADECQGDFMLYSSGTTGRPKGIRRPMSKHCSRHSAAP